MTSNTPPAPRVWWKAPLEKSEILWVVLALAWCLTLSLWRPYSQFIPEPGPRTNLNGDPAPQETVNSAGLSREGRSRLYSRLDMAVDARTFTTRLPEGVHANTAKHERTDSARLTPRQA